MSKRLIYLMAFVLALSGTANAAVYLWNGSAADGLWETPANWTVTDSTWTWPNEETGGVYVNADTLAINIIDGSAVDRADTLRIKGADELTTAVLTLDNASSLTVSGRLSIGTDPDDLPRMGELNVLNGSILTILDGANGNDLYAADDPNTVGTINIVDSIVNVFDNIDIDEGEGTINITNSVIVAGDFKIADSATGVGTLNISGSTVDLSDDFNIDEGEGTINITDSTIVADDIYIGDGATGVGTMNISGTTTITLGDDIMVGDDGVGTLNISGDTILDVPDELYIADEVGSEGHMTISGNAVVNVVDDIDVGDDGLGTLDISENATVNIGGGEELYVATNEGSEGHLTISGNATVTIGDDFDIGTKGLGTANISGNATVSCDDIELANEATGVATLDISGTATVNAGDDIDLGKKGVGTLNISGDATLHVPDELYIGDDGGSEGHMNVSGNATVTVVDDIDVGDDGPGTLDISENATVNVEDSIKIAENGGEGHMTVSGNATVNVDDDIEPGCSGAIGTMDIGENATVNLGDDFEIGVDAGGEGHLTISGNASVTCDDLAVGMNLDSITSLTMNGGSMIASDDLRMGNSGGDDIGQSRIFMNGGLLQAEELKLNITDRQIIYTGGVFQIGAADLDVAGMQQLVADGTIVIAEGLVHSIASNGIYTGITPLSPSVPKMPDPADGTEGVPYGRSLNWAPGDTAVTNDVYFGTTNPPAFADSVEATTYYPGPLEQGTTYYWQVDSVEADGTTKHSSEVWSFTATTKTKKLVLDIRIADDSDDAEEDVGGKANFEIDLTSGDLEFTSDNEAHKPEELQVVGIRFVDIGIPAGTTITSASVQFDADDVDDDEHVGDAYTLIEGELSPDPVTFANEPNNITGRPRTTAQVPWGPAHWDTKGEQYWTSDISSVIQEIVNQDGWALGNALVLIFSQDPVIPSVGILEAEAGPGDDSALLHIETGAIQVATQASPADGAEGMPLDATLGWWPGANAVSHNVYLATSTMASLSVPPTYLVDGDSHSLPWEVDDGTISFDGQIYDDGGDSAFISAGASGNTFDVPDYKNWAKLSFDFDVDSVEFIYSGNSGNITVEARDNAGARIDSFYQADTHGGQPAGPVTLSGPGIRSLYWKDTSGTKRFAALDNILLTLPVPALLGDTTQLSFDPGVLTPSTTYYWQIDTVEGNGTIHTGTVWSFTTEPGEATQPDPADKAIPVALDKILSWKPGATAATHDVYLGTTSPPSLIGNQTDPNFDPAPLEFGTTYYWQIDEVEADGTTVYTGDIWSFTTVLDIPITDPNLVGLWTFDEGEGTIAIDWSGHNHYGTVNGATWVVDGQTGGALSFDGITDIADRVEIPTADISVSAGTVAMWAKLAPDPQGPASRYFFGHTTIPAYGNRIQLYMDDSDTTLDMGLGDDHNRHKDIGALATESWYHIALTWDGSNYVVYVNGEQKANGSYTGLDALNTVADIGNDGNTDGRTEAFNGLLDDVRIYNIAVSEAEIRVLVGLQEAWSPDPADGATEVQKTLTLSWLPEGTATIHYVYLSADQQAVIDGTVPLTAVTGTSYSPADLEKGITYYWRVDVVEADGTTHTGPVWSFTVTTLGR